MRFSRRTDDGRRPSTEADGYSTRQGSDSRTHERSFGGRSISGLTLGAVAVLFAFSGVASAQSDSSGTASLEDAVVGEMSEQSGRDLTPSTTSRSAASGSSTTPATQVNVMRDAEGQDADWAFGSSVIEAPKKEGYYPQGWLFVARNDGDGWEVGLEGDAGFSELADEAPTKVVSEGEKETFAKNTGASGQRTTTQTRSTSAASTPTRTGLMLPWKSGTSWSFTGGPHGWASGYDRPYTAMDLTGRGADQRVRAAGGGKVYRMCNSGQGWVRVYHANGLSTDYYHLWNTSQFANGRQIERGRVLGVTGEDVSCGGAAYGRHVHFALLRGENHIPVHNRTIGGWTFKQAQAYQGSAQRGGTVRYAGGSSTIKNFGAS